MASKTKNLVFPKKYVAAVELGVKWLDLTFGRKNWLKRMDMSGFDIDSTHTCVAGNVFRDVFFNGVDSDDSGYSKFTAIMDTLGVGDRQGEKFGFYSQSEKGMQHLQDLWVRKIINLKRAEARKK